MLACYLVILNQIVHLVVNVPKYMYIYIATQIKEVNDAIEFEQ